MEIFMTNRQINPSGNICLPHMLIMLMLHSSMSLMFAVPLKISGHFYRQQWFIKSDTVQ